MIKEILDEIAAESSTNQKMVILEKYKDNELLKEVLYKAKSPRIKFYIKQIPEHNILPIKEEDQYTLGQILVKIEDFSNREMTGNIARDYLKNLLEKTSEDNNYILQRIIDKDLKFGMGRSNINKVIPDLIEKTPYMGAKSYSEKLARKIFEEDGVAYSQVKMDGRYCNAILQEDGEVELVSRQGETTYVGDAPFLKELGLIKNMVLNGELTVDGYDRYTANGLIASIVDIEGKQAREERTPEETEKKIAAFEKKHAPYLETIDKIRFTVWDCITLEEYFEKKTATPYKERLSILEGLLRGNESSEAMLSIVETIEVKTFKEAMEHFQDALERGLEGTILKSTTGAWKDGKPNWQVKLKLEMNIDLRIIGFKYGTEGTKNEHVISTILAETSCGILKTNPSGMKEAMMQDVTERQEELLGTIVEIRCCGLSQNSKGEWSTLHPSVAKLRDDKDTCDSLESAKEIEEAAMNLT
jgi:hypothetical protein